MKKKIDKNEILKMMVNSGSINCEDVAQFMESLKKLDNQHPYKISQGKDGFWRTRVKDSTKKDGRRQIKKSNYKDLISFLIKHYEEQEKEISEEFTFVDFYNVWMKQRKLEVCERTRNKDQYNYIRFLKGTDFINKKLKDITILDFKTFALTTIKKHNQTPRQYTDMSVIIKGCFNLALEMGIVETNPVLAYRPPNNVFRKEPKARAKDSVFTVKEELLIINAVKNRKNKDNLAYLAVELNFRLGLRVGELSALKWTDIKDNHIEIKRTE